MSSSSSKLSVKPIDETPNCLSNTVIKLVKLKLFFILRAHFAHVEKKSFLIHRLQLKCVLLTSETLYGETSGEIDSVLTECN